MKRSALTRSIDKKSGKKKEWSRQESGALVNMATYHYRLSALEEEDEGYGGEEDSDEDQVVVSVQYDHLSL